MLTKQFTVVAFTVFAGLGVAFAGEAQGTITFVNANAMTVTMDNGETYTLPPEFDVSLITPGMVVALAHDDDTARTVTDMEQID
ncbi:MAG: DUF1344 domain-containing protein [Pseudomonadota bacterium]